MNFRSQIVSFSTKRITGWAYDVDAPAKRVTLCLKINGEDVARIVCNRSRKDLDPVEFPSQEIGFGTSVPLRFWTGRPIRIVLAEETDGTVVKDAQLATSNICLNPDSDRPVFGEISSAGADRVEGWVTDLDGILEVELDIDGVLVDVQAADRFVFIDERRVAGFSFTRFPRSVYDGAAHVVRVVARSDSLVTVGEATVLFPAEAAPQFMGVVQSVVDGRLKGTASYPEDPDRVAEIVLTVDGQERARTLSQTGTGAFAFDLAALKVTDWLAAEIALVNTDGDVPLRYAGQHPIRDGVIAEIRHGEGGAPALFLSAPVPLPVQIRAEIAAQDGETLALAIDNPERASTLTLPIAGAVPARDPQITLNGLSLKGAADRDPVAVSEPSDRDIGDFVEARDVRVRRALTQRVRQTVGGHGEPGYSGGWVFEAPAEVRGWALDLADDRPLVVALVADDEIVALTHAKDRVVVRDAGFRFETPTGFRFDLAAFAAIERARTIDVCVLPGRRRLPGTAVQVDPSILEAIASREARLDALVREGALAEAYLVARAWRRRDGAGAPERLQILDFALRTEWRGYDRVLAAAEGYANEAVLHRLRDAARGQETEGSAAGISGLPPVYDELVEAAVRARAREVVCPRSDRERIERASLWRMLQALPENGVSTADRRKVALVVAHGPAEASYEAFYDDAAAAGCRVIRLPQAAEASLDPRKIAEISGAEVAVVLRAPRLLGLAALAYLPALLAGRSGLFAASGADVLAGNRNDPDFEFVGFYADEAVRILPAADAVGLRVVLAGTGEAPEPLPGIIAFTLVSPADLISTDAPVVIHDADAADALPAIPGAFRLLPLPLTTDRIATLASTLAELGRTSAPDTLVMVLDSAFQYPASYVEDVQRDFVLAGSAVSTVNMLVAYDPMKQRFYFNNADVGQKLFLGHVALGGYRLGDLTESFERYGTGGSIVVATTMPFVHIPLKDSVVKDDLVLASRTSFKKESAHPLELQKGFIGQTYATWTGTFQGKSRHTELDAAVAAVAALTRTRAQVIKGQVPKTLLTEVNAVIEVGRPDLARAALLDIIALRAADGQIIEGELKQIIDLAKRLGLREELVRQLGFRALFSLGSNADLIIPLFETLAVVLPSDQVAAAITAATALVLAAPSNKSLYRIVDVARRFSDAEVMIIVVNMIANADQTEIFSEEAFASIIGDALIGSTICDSSFINQRYKLEYFTLRAPVKSKISHSMRQLDARKLCDEINQYFAEGGNIRELILLLRTYSSEMSDIGLAGYGIQYPDYADRDQGLALAIMFDDAEAIARYEGATAETISVWDPLAIAAATYRQTFGPLKQAFAAWAEGEGIETPDFSGASIHEMFRRLLATNTGKPAARDHGKVSVIVTVYNPDLELLDLALRSVLTQTYQNLEVILVDDASDETPADAIAAMAGLDPRIRFLRVPKNSGPYVGRNEALKIAQGAFVAIQDGDDFSHPQRIEKQVEKLVACPVYQICTTAHLRIDRRARLQFEHTLTLRGDGTMTSMFRRSVFDVLGAFIHVRSRGDVEFRQRVLKSHGAHAVTHIDTPMVFCFAAPSSLSNTTARNLHDYLTAFRASIDKTVAAPVLEGRRHAERCIDVEVPWPMRPL